MVCTVHGSMNTIYNNTCDTVPQWGLLFAAMMITGAGLSYSYCSTSHIHYTVCSGVSWAATRDMYLSYLKCVFFSEFGYIYDVDECLVVE